MGNNIVINSLEFTEISRDEFWKLYYVNLKNFDQTKPHCNQPTYLFAMFNSYYKHIWNEVI